jgi:NAD(P)-dependent dehydrogenase (short-subunit alcohol dehydrogenase family)
LDALFAAREVIPERMVRRQGRIINIASIGGKIALPHVLPYTVRKFALVGLSNGLRVELARHDIVVTTICPGFMHRGSHPNAEFKGRHEDE